MSYRNYRLNITTRKRTVRETGKVRDHVKRLEITIRDHKFDGKDPVKEFNFFLKLVSECNTLYITEGQAYIFMTYFLEVTAKEQFTAVKSATTDE